MGCRLRILLAGVQEASRCSLTPETALSTARMRCCPRACHRTGVQRGREQPTDGAARETNATGGQGAKLRQGQRGQGGAGAVL